MIKNIKEYNYMIKALNFMAKLYHTIYKNQKNKEKFIIVINNHNKKIPE